MNGETHLAVGIGAATAYGMTSGLFSSKPETVAIAFTLSICGSLMPDLDTYRSGYKAKIYHGSINRLFILTVSYMLVKSNSILHASIILGSIILGIASKHRGFTHKLPGYMIYSVLMYMTFGISSIYFVIAYGSHLFLDSVKPTKVLFSDLLK